MMYFAKNDHPGILITCPHCRIGARHDTGAVEDAIREQKEIECVSCGEKFRIMFFVGGVDWARGANEAIPGVVDDIEELWE